MFDKISGRYDFHRRVILSYKLFFVSGYKEITTAFVCTGKLCIVFKISGEMLQGPVKIRRVQKSKIHILTQLLYKSIELFMGNIIL